MTGPVHVEWRPRRPRWFFPLVLVAVGSLVAGLCIGLRVFTGGSASPASQAGKSVPVYVVHGRTVKTPVMRQYHAPPVSWPAAATATAVLPAAAAHAKAAPLTAGPSAGSSRAGDLPVWIGPPDAAVSASQAGGKPVTTASMSGSASAQVQVAMASHATASALGVRGLVLSLTPGDGPVSRVHVSVNYASFAEAYGGDYASRLRVVELPACALTTPQVLACHEQTPVPSGSADDVRTNQVGADVTLPGTSTAAAVRPRQAVLTAAISSSASSSVVLAVTSGEDGSGGDYAVPPTSEMSEWVNGGSSGAYRYSYPITLPSAPGGLEPTVSLDYDSQLTDGITSATNPQASWIGDGWGYSPGYIEADYSTCASVAASLAGEGSAPPDTQDLCLGPGSSPDLTLSLDGAVTTLIDTSSGWQAEGGGFKISQVTSSGTGQPYWVVTSTAGASYYFGMDQLPSYASGDQETDSLWTVPVDEGTDEGVSDEPPFLPEYSWSWTQQPWRWNLDYVTDTHGDAIAYFYNEQVNYYAEDNGNRPNAEYGQGGTLNTIEYGLRAGDIYGYTPAAQVNFAVTAGRQDAPTDLSCTATAACDVDAPTFWNDDALTGIATQADVNGSLQKVDSWALSDEYPATGDSTTSPSLWLSSITRTGIDGSTPVTLPPVTFAGTPMPNRVMTTADTAAGYSLMTRFRLTSITNPAGGVTKIAYAGQGCTAGDFPAPDANATTCYPSYWQANSSPGVAPAAPSGLTVTGTTYSTASLSWTAPPGTVSGYNVFEDGTELPSGSISASVSGTTATVSGLSASTTYIFTVQADNMSGTSPQSSSVQAATAAAPPVPGAPGTLTGTGCTITGEETECSVHIQWSAASGTVTGYDVYMEGSLLTTTTATAFSTSFPTIGGREFYVEAYNSSGNGPASNTVDCYVTKSSTAASITGPPVRAVTLAAVVAQQSSGSSSSPVEDWFNLYPVTSVTETDTTGADPPVVTSYTYATPAWHDDDDSVSRSVTTTWDEWRGFRTVTTSTGTKPDPVTETVDTYFQGMSGDETAGGCTTYSCSSTTVTLTASRGQTETDSDQYAGSLFESIVYDGSGSGNQVSDTIDTMSTVEENGSGENGIESYLAQATETATYTPTATGGTRESTVTDTDDQYGRVTQKLSVPDTSNPAESTCTLTSYNTNTTTNVMDQVSQIQTIAPDSSSACTVTSASQAVSATQYTYDSTGDTTQTKQGTAATESGGALSWTWQTSNTSTFDEYGRVLTSADADSRTTTTAYTPATGAEPASESVTDPMGLVTTTTYDPARDLPLTVTDPAGGVTTSAYDALGRQTAQWTPGNPASGPATTTWSYTVSATAPWVTTEQDLEPGGNYLTTQTLYDSFGDKREVQQETANGGTDVTDISYESDGWVSLVSGPYYTSGAPSGTLIATSPVNVSSETGYSYDGDGRVIQKTLYDGLTEKWATTTAYGGNETTVTPPSGATPQTTWTNGLGQTTAIWQYHAGVPVSVTDPAADYDATSYTYTPAGKLSGITDAAGNQWSYSYNMVGDQVTSADPDAGSSSSTYDAAGQLMSVTDARGKTTAYTYDLDGRKTAEYDTTGGAAETSSDELASWTYDTLAKGQLTSSTAYELGTTFTEQYTGYNSQELPSGMETVIGSTQGLDAGIAETGALAGTYTQIYTYAPDGAETSYTDSAAGNLPAETVTTGYNPAGDPDSLTGASPYVDSLSYTNLGQPLQYQMGTSSEPVYVTDSYDPTTTSLTQQDTQTGTGESSVDDLNYGYNNAGDITSEADNPSSDPDATQDQCFQYDYLGRLVQAWAQGAAACASTPSASAEGGAGPYWDSYSYNSVGNLTGTTSTSSTGAVTTTADTYPAAGSAHPHAITGQSVTASSVTASSSYTYDAAGNLIGVTSPGQDQSLGWTDAGQLEVDQVTPTGGAAQLTGYIYDADGNLLIEADPGATTLSLPGEELSLNTSTGTVTGTRSYNLGGVTVASLTAGSGLSYLVGDQQGTEDVAINASTLAVTYRYYDPYGNPVGPAASSFPDGEQGYDGGVTDTATTLSDLGAREYQSQTGSFVSVDPDLIPYDPQNLNGYAYAADNPATNSDPTGETTTVAENTYYNTCTGQSYVAPYDMNTGCNAGTGGFVASEFQDAITLDLVSGNVNDMMALYNAAPEDCAGSNVLSCVDPAEVALNETPASAGTGTSADSAAMCPEVAGACDPTRGESPCGDYDTPTATQWLKCMGVFDPTAKDLANLTSAFYNQCMAYTPDLPYKQAAENCERVAYGSTVDTLSAYNPKAGCKYGYTCTTGEPTESCVETMGGIGATVFGIAAGVFGIITGGGALAVFFVIGGIIFTATGGAATAHDLAHGSCKGSSL